MKIGILTAGGDCPGINAAIRGVGKTAILEYGMDVLGIASGFSGLIENDYIKLDESSLSGILTTGGTILGTSREKPFKKRTEGTEDDDKPGMIRKNYKKMGLDCLVCIGGNGTMKTVLKLSEVGLSVIGIPKTIDNDVWGTDLSFGFDSAVGIATEAIDRLHTTANSHKRTMVIEVMGHTAGWLALESGMAGGADVILIPELKFNEKTICDFILERYKKEKPYSIVVVAEGIPIENMGDYRSAAHYIASMITIRTGIETRETVLGYVQRGGAPSPSDRILGTIFGAHAVKCISEGESGVMVCLKGTSVSTIPLSDVARKVKCVEQDNIILEKARVMGTCFGTK